MTVSYQERPLETQIKIDQLQRFYNYSPSFYESKTNREIFAIHKSKLSEMATLTIKGVVEPESTQLTFF